MKSRLSIIESPSEFFNELIERIAIDNSISLNDALKFYLVALLSENVNPETLLRKSDKHPYAGQPLSMIFGQALMEMAGKKAQMLKYVGDYTLYMGGYFSDSLKKGIVNYSYYVSIGEDAFGYLSSISKQKHVADLYNDIFNNFVGLLLLLKEAGTLTRSYEAGLIKLNKKN